MGKGEGVPPSGGPAYAMRPESSVVYIPHQQQLIRKRGKKKYLSKDSKGSFKKKLCPRRDQTDIPAEGKGSLGKTSSTVEIPKPLLQRRKDFS